MIHFVSPTQGSIAMVSEFVASSLGGKVTSMAPGDDPMKGYMGGDTLLMHLTPPQIFLSGDYKRFDRRVLILPLDGTHISPFYMPFVSSFDEVICPSTACAFLLRYNGYAGDVKVIPNHLDFNPIPVIEGAPLGRNTVLKDEYVFYHEGFGQERKNIGQICRCFLKAFSGREDFSHARLVVKTRKDDPNAVEYDGRSGISFLCGHMSSAYIQQLRLYADAYVSLARMEGYGIPLFSMAYMDKPVLALSSTDCMGGNEVYGYMDFLDHQYIVQADRMVRGSDFGFYDEERNTWCDVDDEPVVEMMRRLASERVSVSDARQAVRRAVTNEALTMEYNRIFPY